MEPSAEKSEKKKDSKKSSKNLGRRSTRTRKCISYRWVEFNQEVVLCSWMGLYSYTAIQPVWSSPKNSHECL